MKPGQRPLSAINDRFSHKVGTDVDGDPFWNEGDGKVRANGQPRADVAFCRKFNPSAVLQLCHTQVSSHPTVKVNFDLGEYFCCRLEEGCESSSPVAKDMKLKLCRDQQQEAHFPNTQVCL